MYWIGKGIDITVKSSGVKLSMPTAISANASVFYGEWNCIQHLQQTETYIECWTFQGIFQTSHPNA